MNNANDGTEQGCQETGSLSSSNGVAAIQQSEYVENKTVNCVDTNETIQRYMMELDNGSAEAMYELARCCMNNSISDELVQQINSSKTFKTQLNELAKKYACGFLEPDSDLETVFVCTRVEDQNDPSVLCALGRAYNFGWGVEKNVAKAIDYYVRAADAGSYEAMQRLEKCDSKNVTKLLQAAFEHFKQLSNSGSVIAQFSVAYCYYQSIGVRQDNGLTLKTLRKAVDCGCANAMAFLGKLYEQGIIVHEDRRTTFELYKQAADAGNSQGQYYLAQYYYLGAGGNYDREQAKSWYKKAAKQGHAAATYFYASLQDSNRTDGNQTSQFNIFMGAAVAGSAESQCLIGSSWKNTLGAPHNYQRAAYWLQKAADQRHQNAVDQLRECREKIQKQRICQKQMLSLNPGWKTEPHSVVGCQDQKILSLGYETAFLLARFAALNRCWKAYQLVGDCFYSGLGIGKDFTAAAMNYYRANPEDIVVLIRLANCYAAGEVHASELSEFRLLERANAAVRAEIDQFQELML